MSPRSILERTRHALSVSWIRRTIPTCTGFSPARTARRCPARCAPSISRRSAIASIAGVALSSVEEFLERSGRARFDRFNLSDVFEYVSVEHYHRMLEAILRRSRPGARLAYWNMLAPRRRPDHLARSPAAARRSGAAGFICAIKAFFYSAFRVEEVSRDDQSCRRSRATRGPRWRSRSALFWLLVRRACRSTPARPARARRRRGRCFTPAPACSRCHFPFSFARPGPSCC